MLTKKLIYIVVLILLCGCPVYDAPSGEIIIHNNTDEAIYVYLCYGNIDSLPLKPRLSLFEYFDNSQKSMLDAKGNPLESGFVSPEYRINAYNIGFLHILGSKKKPKFPPNIEEITLFFITEKIMRNYSWEKIYEKQLFEKRVLLRKEELDSMKWNYTYTL